MSHHQSLIDERYAASALAPEEQDTQRNNNECSQ